MLRAVREVAERAGWIVRGFAPSATAARVLQQDAGISSDTLAMHLIAIAKESKPWQSANELWVVDESSMISAGQARALVGAADRQKGASGSDRRSPAIAGHRGRAAVRDADGSGMHSRKCAT